ncbi:uncharacterized protein EI90DRAFT_3011842 [Cantharellus anzutake]|uniref:uncharacterized protein n=1 Tax=Cantharellus anzutake TaxID=1750568 RepID=UPI0019074F91|nr:uncharacterized protein EI90DRAFT_3011842 [Cantharellus anzutake]KAF8342353.1 hypothetical protein EI90DRAFT_3011842 [Cantharellus anzutake]
MAGSTALPNANIQGLSRHMVISEDLRRLTYDKAIAVSHALREKAFIGICELKAHTHSSLPLTYGVRNARAIDQAGLDGIKDSIIEDSGPSRLRPDMPVVLLIRQPWVTSTDWPKIITPDNHKSLAVLELSEVGWLAARAGQLQVLNGQHRIGALQAAYAAVAGEVKKYGEAVEGKVVDNMATSEEREIYRKDEERLKEWKLKLLELVTWPAVVYDLGNFLDVLEQDESMGSFVIELLARNKDVIEVMASEEEKLVPVYQHLLNVQVRTGWRPTLWRSAAAAKEGPDGIDLDIRKVMWPKLGTHRKLQRIAADERSNRGLMELVRVGKYYRDWKGFTINHISTKLLGHTCAYLWTYVQAQNERLGLLMTESDVDDNFDYERFEALLKELDGKLTQKSRKAKTEELDELALHFVKTFIDKVERMPPLDAYFNVEFWKGVEDAEVVAGVATIVKKGSKKTQRTYGDDVFQFSHRDHSSRYIDYRTALWSTVEKVLEQNRNILPESVLQKCRHRFNVLFSGIIHRWHMILITNGLLSKFDDISTEYEQFFKESSTKMFANILVELAIRLSSTEMFVNIMVELAICLSSTKMFANIWIHAWIDPVNAYMMDITQLNYFDASYALFDAILQDPLLAVEPGTEVEFTHVVFSELLPCFKHWKIEWDHCGFKPIPSRTNSSSPLPGGFFERGSTYDVRAKTKARVREAKEKVPDDDPSLDPPEPGNHKNGFLGDAPFNISWSDECLEYRTSITTFLRWYDNNFTHVDLVKFRKGKDAVDRAMALYPRISPTQVDAGPNHLHRNSAKWRLSWVRDALSIYAPSPPDFQLVIPTRVRKSLTYFNQPEAFVRALEGKLDSSDEDPEGGSAAQAYHATRVQHRQQLDGLRKAFEGVTFIHKGGKVDGPIDSSIITAWNAFEQHLHRFSVIASVAKAKAAQDAEGSAGELQLFEEDIRLLGGMPPSKFTFKSSSIMAGKRQSTSPVLPKWLRDARDITISEASDNYKHANISIRLTTKQTHQKALDKLEDQQEEQDYDPEQGDPDRDDTPSKSSDSSSESSAAKSTDNEEPMPSKKPTRVEKGKGKAVPDPGQRDVEDPTPEDDPTGSELSDRGEPEQGVKRPRTSIESTVTPAAKKQRPQDPIKEPRRTRATAKKGAIFQIGEIGNMPSCCQIGHILLIFPLQHLKDISSAVKMAAISTDSSDLIELPSEEDTIPPYDIHNPLAEEGYGAVRQDIIARARLGTTEASNQPEMQKFYDTPSRTLPMKTLRHLYINKNGASAFSLLQRKHRLHLDPQFHEPGTSRQYTFRLNGHSIDFSLKVPDRCGFDAILPPSPIGVLPTWSFDLDLCGSLRDFLNRKGDLGFDPRGRMLYIGKFGHDSVFLAMAPNSFLDGSLDPVPCGHVTGPTQMNTSHIRMATSIILWSMTYISDRDYSTLTRYALLAEILINTRMSHLGLWLIGTLIIISQEHNGKLTLRRRDVENMHHALAHYYTSEFVANAPPTWTDDTWFTNSTPLVVTIKYGQDLPLDMVNLEETSTTWNHNFSFQHISRWSIALATHIVVPSIVDTEVLDPQAILEEFGTVFDEHGQVIEDLEHFDLEDEDGEPIPIFDSQGAQIDRKEELFREKATPGGLLFRLNSASHMFDRVYGNPRQSDPYRSESVKTHTYPQAFLTDYGHVQANSVFPEFHKAAQLINQALLAPNVEDDNNNPPTPMPSLATLHVMEPLPSGWKTRMTRMTLMINTLNMKFLLNSQAIQLSQSRGFFSKAIIYFSIVLLAALEVLRQCMFAQGRAEEQRAAQAEAYVSRQMPYERMRQKLLTNSHQADQRPPTDLRLENNWVLNFTAIPADRRTGRHVMEQIIKPLLATWSNPGVVRKLKQHTIILAPGVLPRLYLWATYPVFWGIEQIYHMEQRRKSENHRPDQISRELLAALERAGSFGFCGAGKVLSTFVMDPLLLSLGIKETGFPSLSKIVHLSPDARDTITVEADKWPRDADGVPRFASKRVVVYNYSLSTFDSIVAECFVRQIRDGIYTFSDLASTPMSKHDKIIHGLAAYGVDALLKDALYEVEKGVKRYIDGAKSLADAEDLGRFARQLEELKQLVHVDRPFDNSQSATQRLLLVLCTSPHAMKGMFSDCAVDVLSWVKVLYRMVSPPRPPKPGPASTQKITIPQIGAPFFPDGCARHVLRRVFEALRQLGQHDDWGAQQDFCCNVIVKQMEVSHLCRYPAAFLNPVTKRQTKYAVWHTWTDFIFPDGGPQPHAAEESNDPDYQAARLASIKLTSANPQSSWTWMDTKLSDLTWVFERSRLPTDWITKDNLKDSFTAELTNWLKSAYSASNPRFKLALLASLIITAWAPNHRVKEISEKIPKKISLGANMREYGNNLCWDLEHGQSAAGWKARPPLFHLWLLFISGVLNTSSPWWGRRTLKEHCKGIKKADRTAEQALNDTMFSNFRDKHRSKGIVIAVLARMNLVKALTPKAFTAKAHFPTL